MLSFEEIKIGSKWRTADGVNFVVTGKEAGIIGHNGWVSYSPTSDPSKTFEAEWRTFLVYYEESDI